MVKVSRKRSRSKQRQSGGRHCTGQAGGYPKKRHSGGRHCTGQAGGYPKKLQLGGKPCCAQRGGNSQCGRQRGAGKKQKGGHTNRRQCGAGRRNSRKRGGGSCHRHNSGHAQMNGGRRTQKVGYSARGGACAINDVQLGQSFDLSNTVALGRPAVVRQRGGTAGYKYDCKQPDWGPECR